MALHDSTNQELAVTEQTPPSDHLESYAQDIVDTVREPLLMLDATLCVRSANRAFYKTFKVTPEETEDRLIYELGNGQWDIPSLRNLLEDIVPKSSVFNDFELEHDFPVIGRRVMLLNARRLQTGRHGELVVLAMEDVTARKQAEEALLKAGALQSAIFNSANFSSIATDAKGVIQIFNVGAERMLGYTASEVMNQITPADISDPEEVVARAKELSAELSTKINPGFEALVFKAARGIEDIYELTYIRKDGSRFPAVVSVTALRDAHETIIGYLLIGTDNTARQQVDLEKKRASDLEARHFQELQQNFRRLQELERLRDDLTHMIIHDLRTPLTSLITGVQTLEAMGELNQEQKEMKDIALVGGETLLAMINDLLDVEKLESGTMQLDYGSLPVSDLVSSAIGQVASLAESKGLRLVEQVPPELPPLSGDENKLRRTLVNLLGNAIKFTPTGGTVTVGAREVAGYIELFVSDTGEGIPAESFERIFEKFGQVEARKRGRTMSTGLGLTFCKLAVEAHGGHIQVESAPGLGSTFSFTIPLQPPSGQS